MDARANALASLEVFAGIEPAELEVLARHCRLHRHGANETIVSQEDDNRDVFFVTEGRVGVIAYAACGREVGYRHLGAGQMFGELSAIDGGSRSATVIALQDCRLLRMPAAVFADVLARHPEAAAAMLRWLVALIRALSERVFEFTVLDVRRRIHAELLRLAREQGVPRGHGMFIPSPLTHAEMASRIATHREAISRELSALSREGVVARTAGGLWVRDVDRLADLAEQGSRAVSGASMPACEPMISGARQGGAAKDPRRPVVSGAGCR